MFRKYIVEIDIMISQQIIHMLHCQRKWKLQEYLPTFKPIKENTLAFFKASSRQKSFLVSFYLSINSIRKLFWLFTVLQGSIHNFSILNRCLKNAASNNLELFIAKSCNKILGQLELVVMQLTHELMPFIIVCLTV